MPRKKSTAKNETDKRPVPMRPDEHEVAAYLAAHPDFLRQRPDTLKALDVPHASGNAVSLIERQVQALRQTNAELRARFNELVATARSNEDRVAQLNQVAQIMAGAVSTDGLVFELTYCLREQLAVDRVYVGLQGTLPIAITRVDRLDESPAARRALTNLFRRGQPMCGELSAHQSGALFGTDDIDPMTSAAMIPIADNNVRGAVVLASVDPNRFTADMGTLFVTQLGDLLTATLRRLLGDTL
jgi:uncharacterized protein YigA (DUF484 family)